MKYVKKLLVFIIVTGLVVITWLFTQDNSIQLTPFVGENSNLIKVLPQEERLVEKSNAQQPLLLHAHESSDELYEQANKIRICRRVPKTQSELDTWAEQAHANDEYYEIIDSMYRKFKVCLGSADRDGPYVDMLIEAAEKGSDKAVSLLWLLGDVELVDELKLKDVPRDEQVSRRQAFIATKYRLAHKVALQGGENSMLKLISGFQHLDPQTGGQDYVKSLAFAYFFVEVVSNSDVFGRVEWTIRDLEGKMSPEEITQANELTRDFLAQHRAL
ncbi:hypothetical protein EXT48_20825 [Pseudoalteromonas sp. CO348]|uniref:hypothetical protein n=1 Tax=unclassified Pseudoalteromonas TaxID=194690 RepID=UPI001023B1F7|nr:MULTISPECIES: hypothetical protein [unclassified Pseudoalteromonas]MCG7541601.1 hypothetical protein [Pseudoalteromonas sp. OF7H-1]RZF99388.1 hypothetical protein EXT48_20825 [Pseudoalteromonas sp. CO348]